MAAWCSGIGLIAAAVISYRMPRVYESRAEMEVSFKSGWWTDGSHLMASPRVLRQALKRLDFIPAEGEDPEVALERLRGMVSAGLIGEGSAKRVELRARDADPERARDLAWAVIQAGGDCLAENDRLDAQRALQELEKSVSDQEKRVEEARKKLMDIVREKQIEIRPVEESPAEAPVALEEPKPPMSGEALAEQGRKLAEQNPRAAKIIVFKSPEVPKLPISPRFQVNLAVGALAGLAVSPVLALIAAWVPGRRKRTVDPVAER